MEAPTSLPCSEDVNNQSRQYSRYFSALEDLNRAKEEEWVARYNSEIMHNDTVAHSGQLAGLRAERDAADAALKQLTICLKAGEERLKRAQRQVTRACLEKFEFDQAATEAHLALSRSRLGLADAETAFRREAERQGLLPDGEWDASVSEGYQTPPPEFSSPTEQVEAGEDDLSVREVDVMSVSSSASKMPCLGVEGTTGTPSLVSEPASDPSTEPSVVTVRPLRSSKARSTGSRHQPYFRSAVNIMKWQRQQLGGIGGQSNSEKLAAARERMATMRERMIKSPEVEYLGETVRQDHEAESGGA